MVAASVVTEFSNILNLDIFGDVPHASVMSASEISQHIVEESSVFKTVIHFKAIFHGTELDIAPDFIWMFSDKFVDKIKDIV